jgi:hypothetical protein
MFWTLWCAFVFATLFFAYRNHWVYKTRIAAIYDDEIDYDELPSYDFMMKKFWVWNIEEFIGAYEE